MIYKYELISPVTNRKSPYVDDKDFFIYPNVRKLYRYYIEVKRYNTSNLTYEYFLLLSTEQFDAQCRKCRVDDYGRLKAKLHGEILDYAKDIMRSRGNIEFEYCETEGYYDVWQML